MFYITADPHGDFREIKRFAKQEGLGANDTIIVLGDAGLNYFQNERDLQSKKLVNKIGVTVFCIHGNHEMRPQKLPLLYHLREWNEGQVYVEDEFPNILFAKDGEIYKLGGFRAVVLGGAYSIDKQLRLARGWSWFEDEQPNGEIKQYAEGQLRQANWQVDLVFSHTCPHKYEPSEAFLPGVDQSTVDKSTEIWLDTIEDKLNYKKWYCGHWHIEKTIDKLRFMFHEIEALTTEMQVSEAKNFYTSDLHLGHENIIRFCNRPFNNADEMDAEIIKRWNNKVQPQDHVYIVGDFAYRSRASFQEYCANLSGHKHLIVGNHDVKQLGGKANRDAFESVNDTLMIKDKGRQVFLRHYPLMTWPSRSFLVYGHIHNSINGIYWPLLKTYENAFNAGVDINNFEPVTLEELAINNKIWKESN